MGSTYPDHEPEPSTKWLQYEGRSILKPRGLFIRWGNSNNKYWSLPEGDDQDGAAKLIKVGFIEVSAKKEIDLEKRYQIGFRVSLSQRWDQRFPVFIMAKKQDGNYIARKETFEGRPENGEEFDIPGNFVIRFPSGDHRSSSKPILHMTLCDQWSNVNFKEGLHIHYAFVKEQINESCQGVPAAAEGDGVDRPEGGEGGGTTAVPEQPPRTMPVEEPRAEAVERGWTDFFERSWEPEDFGADYEQFGQTPPAAVATPFSGVPPLRETAISDPPGVRTYAILTPLPPTVMGPSTRSPGVGVSSFWPPLFPIRDEGGSTSAAIPAGSSVPVVDLPLLPRDISYVGAGLCQYTVPEYPLPEDTFDYLGGRTGDERVSVRAADLRALHAQYLYSWNLLQFVGRDPTLYMHDYQRVIDVSSRADDPLTSSRTWTESRRSSSRTSRRSRSSVIHPTTPIQSTRLSQVAVPPPSVWNTLAQINEEVQPDLLSGDLEDVTYKDDQGFIRCVLMEPVSHEVRRRSWEISERNKTNRDKSTIVHRTGSFPMEKWRKEELDRNGIELNLIDYWRKFHVSKAKDEKEEHWKSDKAKEIYDDLTEKKNKVEDVFGEADDWKEIYQKVIGGPRQF
ncbi:hypothetical protein LguiB_005335 [Lonicera macranthoides]